MKRLPRYLVTSVRVFLGLMFVLLGLVKTADPVGFMKLVRDFGVLEAAPGLNLTAAVLPWFEIFCGGLLAVGVKIRAAALVQALLLVGFTVLIAARAIALHQAGTSPFCSLRFDCGCGTGEVLVCLKLAENGALILLTTLVFWSASPGDSQTA